MKVQAPETADPFDRIPLLAPPFSGHTPESWRTYVEGLYDETAGKKGRKKKATPKPFTVSRNKKGSIIFRVKRDPKWVLESELEDAGNILGLEPKEVRLLVEKRKIEIRKDAK